MTWSTEQAVVAARRRRDLARRSILAEHAMVGRLDEVLDKLLVPRDIFAGHVALIAGGANGIGEALARALATLGASVAIVDFSDSGERVVSAIRTAGGQAMFVRCDLADARRLDEAVGHVEQSLGPIDIFVHSAISATIAPLLETTLEQWDRLHAVVARAHFQLVSRLLPGMIASKRGVVLAISSLETVPHGSALNSAKAAQRALTQTVARELGPDSGVAVFCVLPGVVDTEGFRASMLPGIARMFGVDEPEALARMAHNPGYDGMIPVDDCGAAIAYLVAHGAEYHGQIADVIEPLARHGVIFPPSDWRAPATHGAPEFLNAFQEVTARNEQLERRIDLRTRELKEAHARSESLLLNILPASIATRLKQGTASLADRFDDVTVLFADLVGFTTLATRMPPEELVSILDAAFSSFDEITRRAGLEKIKTIGDCYMVVGGLPEPRADHASAVAHAALELRDALADVASRRGVHLECRIGMHSGPVVAGVIGTHKFAYDLWGDTVNTASRMESHGLPGAIHCTEAVVRRLHGRFRFDERGTIEVKGKGPMRTFWLAGLVDAK